jgi:hypothetical protein
MLPNIVRLQLILIALTTASIPLAAGADAIYAIDYQGADTISKLTAGGAWAPFASGGIDGPSGVAFDVAGDVYVANDGDNYTGYAYIEKYGPAGGAGTTFATWGLVSPSALVGDASGNLYAADGDVIYEYTTAGSGSVFAAGGLLRSTDGGGVTALAFDKAGDLFAARHDGKIVEIPRGGGSFIFATIPGAAVAGYDMAVDGAGNLFVSASAGAGWAIEKYAAGGTWSAFGDPNSGVIGFEGNGDMLAYQYAPGTGARTVVDLAPDGTESAFPSTPSSTLVAIDPTPEPATLSLLALGALTLLRKRRRARA